MDKKGKRKIKVPISMCKDITEFTGRLEYCEFYSRTIDGKDYLFDIRQSTDNNFYVQVIDTTDCKYDVIHLDKFKEKYAAPTLFDFL